MFEIFYQNNQGISGYRDKSLENKLGSGELIILDTQALKFLYPFFYYNLNYISYMQLKYYIRITKWLTVIEVIQPMVRLWINKSWNYEEKSHLIRPHKSGANSFQIMLTHICLITYYLIAIWNELPPLLWGRIKYDFLS
jgi:hypothetical protein